MPGGPGVGRGIGAMSETCGPADGAAAAVSPAIRSSVLNRVNRLFHDACESHVREQFGGAGFQAAWDESNSLTFDQAVALALRQDDEESPAKLPVLGNRSPQNAP